MFDFAGSTGFVKNKNLTSSNTAIPKIRMSNFFIDNLV
jgi:hypothetical protein